MQTLKTTDAKQKTLHYEYRKTTGDTRNWGSPWNIFLDPSNIEKKRRRADRKTFVVNGELIEAETEAFIREKLGLPKEEKKCGNYEKSSEVCEPKTTSLQNRELYKLSCQLASLLIRNSVHYYLHCIKALPPTCPKIFHD